MSLSESVRTIADPTARIQGIQDTIDRCEWVHVNQLCTHCEEKADLISIACAWAFELGRSLNEAGLDSSAFAASL